MHRYCTIVVALTLAGSCGAQPAPAASPPAVSRAPTVTVKDPGASPQQVLRLAPRPGTRHDFDMRMSRETLDAGPNAVEAPPMTWSFTTVVEDSPAPGQVRAEFDCAGVRVHDVLGMPPDVLDGMRRAVQGLAGLRGIATLTDRGIAMNAQVITPPDLNPALTPYVIGISNMVRQLATPLPEQPVGIGATWIAESVEDLEGLIVRLTVRYTLLETDGTTLKLDFELHQTGGDQQVVIMGTPARIKAFSNEGAGTVVRRLDQVFPHTVELTLVNDFTVELGAPGPPQEVRQRMRQLTSVTTTRP